LLSHCSALVSTDGLSQGAEPPESGTVDRADDASTSSRDAEASAAEAGCQVDVLTSRTNCGTCGFVCGSRTGAACRAGVCVPPRRCSELMGATPPLPSGVYRIAPEGTSDAGSAFDAYCDLDPGAAGGGWTLVLKDDGATDVFRYDSPLWTNADTYAAGSPDLDTTPAKLAGYAAMPLTELRVGMVDQGATRWTSIPLVASSLREVLAGAAVTTSVGRAAWRSLLAQPSTQLNCNREGFNQVSDTGNDRVRIGILFNNEADCFTIDSFIGIGTYGPVFAGNHAIANALADDGPRETIVMAYLMIR
jgi:hypothetical protein